MKICNTSIVKLQSDAVKLKTVTRLLQMNQSDSSFTTELEAMSDVLKITDDPGLMVAAVDLAIKSYYFTGLKIEKRAVA
jgi:hypothetical protein